ncbi:hypothetical protein ACOJVU_01690 [Mycobacterium sp. THU-M104]|uniref:hypothetical protein n=1 Tax=Mycobacterium sp. THU-M104 TaxID=3410515 RepID=UPI003B990FFF
MRNRGGGKVSDPVAVSNYNAGVVLGQVTIDAESTNSLRYEEFWGFSTPTEWS